MHIIGPVLAVAFYLSVWIKMDYDQRQEIKKYLPKKDPQLKLFY